MNSALQMPHIFIKLFSASYQQQQNGGSKTEMSGLQTASPSSKWREGWGHHHHIVCQGRNNDEAAGTLPDICPQCTLWGTEGSMKKGPETQGSVCGESCAELRDILYTCLGKSSSYNTESQ